MCHSGDGNIATSTVIPVYQIIEQLGTQLWVEGRNDRGKIGPLVLGSFGINVHEIRQISRNPPDFMYTPTTKC